MAKNNYNTITKYAGTAAKHHNVTNPAQFIGYMVREFDAHTIFFYDAATRQYVGYWRRNMTYSIHN